MLIECVPNVSEGRRAEVIAAMADAIRAVRASGCSITRPTRRTTDRSSRWSATRPASSAPCWRCSSGPSPIIDLRTHRGEHPRLGAVDVVPFVPIEGVTMADCVALARKVGAAVAERFQLPVYLYEEASANPGAQEPRRHPARRVRRARGEDGDAGMGARLRPGGAASQRRRVGDRRAHAAHRLQHQPRDRSARRRQEDRRRHPAQQRRLPLRQGDGHHARGSRHRPGVDEPDQLREDADLPRVRNRQARSRARTAWRFWRAKSSGWCRRPR